VFAFDGIVAFHRVEKPAKEIREFRCVFCVCVFLGGGGQQFTCGVSLRAMLRGG
jgi:hypothetical protein